VEKEILKESFEFSKERNPLNNNPKKSLSKNMRSPAGMISGFGRKMLQIESRSPVDLSRKAKFITTIAIGDPKMNQFHSTDQELNGKSIAPP